MSIDPDDAESRITEKTKAIIPVHYAGFPSDMDGMLKLSEKYGIPLIEDAAQGLDLHGMALPWNYCTPRCDFFS